MDRTDQNKNNLGDGNPKDLSLDDLPNFRAHAYNLWSRLRRQRPWPSVADLDAGLTSHFRPYSFLMDVRNPNEPIILYIGERFGDRFGGRPEKNTRFFSLTTDLFVRHALHNYFVALEARSAVNFNGEMMEPGSTNVAFAGCFLPLSLTQNKSIDLLYGVMNWREENAQPEQLLQETLETDFLSESDDLYFKEGPYFGASSENAQFESKATETERGIETEIESVDLKKALKKYRKNAGVLKRNNGRSRDALYTVLADCLRFYELSLEAADRYAALLKKENLKTQCRAPFTPILKLIFGVKYNKARITEYAATLFYARRNDVVPDALSKFIQNVPGGIKGCVNAERQARKSSTGRQFRPEQTLTLLEAEKIMRKHAPVSLQSTDLSHEFCLLIGRANQAGEVEVIGVADVPRSTVKTVILKAAKKIKKRIKPFQR